MFMYKRKIKSTAYVYCVRGSERPIGYGDGAAEQYEYRRLVTWTRFQNVPVYVKAVLP